jgi:ribosomal protein S6--L-glutamate ligase
MDEIVDAIEERIVNDPREEILRHPGLQADPAADAADRRLPEEILNRLSRKTSVVDEAPYLLPGRVRSPGAVTDLADSYKEVLASALEAYLTVVSNRLNEVMKVLDLLHHPPAAHAPGVHLRHEPRVPVPRRRPRVPDHDAGDDRHRDRPADLLPPPALVVTAVRIVLLSRRRTLYSTRRLIEVAEEAGHEVHVIDPLRCNLVLDRNRPSMFHGREEVRDMDVVLPRIGATITDFGLAVVNHFDMMGVPVVNSATSIARTRDKLRCLQLLTRHDIDIPRTVMFRNPAHLAGALEMVGGLPVILKLLQGTQGIGVMIAETRSPWSRSSRRWGTRANILLQEFVRESGTRRARARGRRPVIAAMRRKAAWDSSLEHPPGRHREAVEPDAPRSARPWRPRGSWG